MVRNNENSLHGTILANLVQIDSGNSRSTASGSADDGERETNGHNAFFCNNLRKAPNENE